MLDIEKAKSEIKVGADALHALTRERTAQILGVGFGRGQAESVAVHERVATCASRFAQHAYARVVHAYVERLLILSGASVTAATATTMMMMVIAAVWMVVMFVMGRRVERVRIACFLVCCCEVIVKNFVYECVRNACHKSGSN